MRRRIIPIFIILIISLVISLSLTLHHKEIKKEEEILKEKEEIEKFRFSAPLMPEESPTSTEGVKITEERVGRFRFFVPPPTEPQVIEEKREEIKIKEYQFEGGRFLFLGGEKK